ncbi:kelch-like protein 17, partial [Glossina fuscipes]|uniref:Kelch-like protein 17 n=1 Tax=Glossina fuscipes TaxID=7396 RepID=A0A9C5ZIZ7_9MUSC
MSQIRLPLVSTEFLTNHIVAESLLIEDNKCNKIVMEALIYQLTTVIQLHEKCQTESKHRNESFHVFLVGAIRDDERRTKECQVYDISKNKLFFISSGGLNSGVCLKTAECYDPASRRWSYIAPMNNARHGFGICTYNDLIYVVGGYQTFTVESYNPSTNKWHLCQAISGTNEGLNRATVAENSIYSLAQVTNRNNALRRFDSRDGRWYNLNEMPGIPDP